MPKPSGRRNLDEAALQEATLHSALTAPWIAVKANADTFELIATDSPTASALGTTDQDRFVATLRHTAKLRDELLVATRYLVVGAASAGVSQRSIAAALGVSTQTINRWLKESKDTATLLAEAESEPKNRDSSVEATPVVAPRKKT